MTRKNHFVPSGTFKAPATSSARPLRELALEIPGGRMLTVRARPITADEFERIRRAEADAGLPGVAQQSRGRA